MPFDRTILCEPLDSELCHLSPVRFRPKFMLSQFAFALLRRNFCRAFPDNLQEKPCKAGKIDDE